MAEFFNEYGALLWEGTLETLYMTLFATLFAYVTVSYTHLDVYKRQV